MLGLRDSQTRNIPPRSFVTGVHSRQNFGILASEILPAKQTCLDKKDRGLPVQDMIDHRSYAHNLSSCKIKAWKKKKDQPWTGLEPMTSAIPVQGHTNWAIKPFGRVLREFKSLLFFALFTNSPHYIKVRYKEKP